MMQRARPLTIGLPVYNGGTELIRAIDSLLGQTCSNFDLLISDNASTDGTEDVCREYANHDDRIRYERQPENRGALANFAFVLDRAETPNFMWAACDDFWLPAFVGENLAALQSNSDLVCSVSQVEFMDENRAKVEFVGPPEHRHPLEGGTFPLIRSPAENVVEYIERPQCNTRFYGIHRTDIIKRCYSVKENYLAADWVMMARTLRFGKHHEVPEVLMRRGVHGASSNVTRLILETNPSWISRNWFPMWPMTRHILFEPGIPVDYLRLPLIGRLLKTLWHRNKLEYHHHRGQIAGG